MENRGGGAAPTGCYKCGRPGHWSRDCPSNPNSDSNLNPNPNSTDNTSKSTSSYSFKTGPGGGASKPPLQKSTEKPKKVPKTRPKLTPELLLSNDGIGFVLRHFPRAFKYRGRGHEVSNLGNLLGLYAEWHSHLIPYYSFNQFVHKVEQVGASKRVKLCVKDLRDRVANGGDPNKLHESPVEHEISNQEQDTAMDLEETTLVQQDASLQNHDIAATDMGFEEPTLVQQDASLQNHGTADDLQNELLNEIYQTATTEVQKEPSEAGLNDEAVAAAAEKLDAPNANEIQNPTPNINNSSNKIEFSEEQRARIEANRQKALERAAARRRQTSTTTSFSPHPSPTSN